MAEMIKMNILKQVLVVRVRKRGVGCAASSQEMLNLKVD
jgi:hypothetical protein